MNTHANKAQENTLPAKRQESQSVANEVSQKQRGSKFSFRFADNRPEAVGQRKLQEIADNSPQVKQLRYFQEIANKSTPAKQTAQLLAIDDNHSAQQQQPIQKKENITGLPDSKTTSSNVAQRVAVGLDVGAKHYNANYENVSGWVTFQKNGQTCWLYIRKCLNYNKDLRRFVASDFIVPFIESWIGGNLILYRGVDAGHAVYDQAQRGLAPAKPDATEDIPSFTSDSSLTRFIPFSTSRDVALMGAKSSSNEGGDRHGEAAQGPDDQIGVMLRLQVGTENSIGIFDDGEIQVLAPPLARVIPVIGTTLQYGNRLDRGALDAEAILRHLHERLDDPMWSNIGEAFIGRKVPDGVERMKNLLQRDDWQGILDLAQTKYASEDVRRHPETKELYRSLSELRKKVGIA